MVLPFCPRFSGFFFGYRWHIPRLAVFLPWLVGHCTHLLFWLVPLPFCEFLQRPFGWPIPLPPLLFQACFHLSPRFLFLISRVGFSVRGVERPWVRLLFFYWPVSAGPVVWKRVSSCLRLSFLPFFFCVARLIVPFGGRSQTRFWKPELTRRFVFFSWHEWNLLSPPLICVRGFAVSFTSSCFASFFSCCGFFGFSRLTCVLNFFSMLRHR